MPVAPPLAPEAARAVTMSTVAKRAGVHPSTVSLVLRDDPRVSASTRARVERAVTALDYRPDPLVAALMTRRRRRGTAVRASLGYVAWSARADAMDFFAGASARAGELGYSLDRFVVGAEGLRPERFSQVATARGLHGLLLGPAEHRQPPVALAWSRFALIAYGYSLDLDDVPRVASDYAAGMFAAVARCRAAGHRRIGLLLDERTDAKANHLWLGAYLAAERTCADLEPVAPFLTAAWDPAAFARWLGGERPTVLIGLHARMQQAWHPFAAHTSDPQSVLLDTHAQRAAAGFGGVEIDRTTIGRAAIDQLVSMLHRGERGLRPGAPTLLVAPAWRDGACLRSPADRASVPVSTPA